MIELGIFLIVVIMILAIVYFAKDQEDCQRCPQCGGLLFKWTPQRLDCPDCSYKKYY